ncbi:Mannosylglycoprotein endo-beta-mannosidase [Linum grandiflorum]
MGNQSLYNVTITANLEGHGESDTWNQLFGFRKIESTIDSSTGGRLFKVNGHRIFIRGGNWIVSDGLLRLSRKRYQTDIKFHADMNFNMIRCWGGGLAERPDFYHYCDVYGILVWQEFWITGDVDGRGDPVSNPNGPLDHDLFLFCARDTVKLLRNHPSLALWVGGNEQVPPPDINNALKKDLRLMPEFQASDIETPSEHDSPSVSQSLSNYLDGTRVYVQGSMWDGFADGKGNFTDGPYEIQYPESFFKDDFYKYGFNPEVGSVGMPVAATIRATMPPEGWQIPLFNKQADGYVEEVPNPIWNYHKYIHYSKPSNKVHDQILLYGLPTDLDDFCLKAQLVNYIQYRALLEGYSSRMWTKHTGVLIWKNQNPWTGLRGQFYDHLLDQTAGFYGCRSAAEPIHVQLNLATYFIEVVNTLSQNLSNVAIEASVWDLDGTCPYYKVHEDLSFPSKKTTRVAEMKYPNSKNPKPAYFLLLKLYNKSDYSILSRNFYWLHLPGSDYTSLQDPFRKKKIPLKLTTQTFITGRAYEMEVLVQNRSSSSKNLTSSTHQNNFIAANHGDNDDKGADYDLNTELQLSVDGGNGKKDGLFRSLSRLFSTEGSSTKVSEVNGSDVGVAFFLQFSVHAAKSRYEEGEDTRILPVHYSDNYFSLVPGEEMTVKLSFEVPAGVTPRVTLHGWNYPGGHTVHH